MLEGWLLGGVAGIAAGFLAGLGGLGGGLVYTPLFAFWLADAPVAVPVFAGLVATAFTGGASAWSHARLGHLDRALLLRVVPLLWLGAAAGLAATLALPRPVVLLAMAGLDLWIAVDLGRRPRGDGRRGLFWLALPIGFVSGMLGIGGGTMLVPLLVRMGAPLAAAVGTSAVAGFSMVAFALAANLAIGWEHWAALLAPAGARLAGAWLGIALVVPLAARLGARLHDRAPETARRLLRLIFLGLSAALVVLALDAAWR